VSFMLLVMLSGEAEDRWLLVQISNWQFTCIKGWGPTLKMPMKSLICFYFSLPWPHNAFFDPLRILTR